MAAFCDLAMFQTVLYTVLNCLVHFLVQCVHCWNTLTLDTVPGEQPDQAVHDGPTSEQGHRHLPGSARQLHHQGHCARDRVWRGEAVLHPLPGIWSSTLNPLHPTPYTLHSPGVASPAAPSNDWEAPCQPPPPHWKEGPGRTLPLRPGNVPLFVYHPKILFF